MESEYFEQDEDGSYILQGEKAVGLWQLGSDKWNHEIERFPEASVDFTDIDFSKLALERSLIIHDAISFNKFIFPDGLVSFLRTSFGNYNVTFSGAKFGAGHVFFNRANFGEGDIIFDHSSFCNSSVSFLETDFGEGRVSFLGTIFDRVNVSFLRSVFSKAGDVNFSDLKSTDSTFIFDDMKFGNGSIIAQWITISGDLDFNVNFVAPSKLDFNHSRFKAKGVFENIKNTYFLEDINFKNCAFEDVLLLPKLEKGKSFNFVPDVVNTKLSHHVDTTGISVELEPYKSETKLLGIFPKTLWGEEGDSQKLMRLKEIAEDHKDHDKALDFFKWEMRAKRWRDGKIWGNLLDLAYDGLSDYGKSVMKPVAGLASVFGVWTFIYKCMSAFHGTWGDAIAFSASQALLGVPSTKLLGGESYERLFKVSGETGMADVAEPLLSGWEHLVIYLENFLAFIFLFLIGLALRNRFRLR